RLIVLPQHELVVHLVDVVAGENQNVPRLLGPDGINVLVNRVRRTQIPVFAHALHGRQNFNEFAQIAGHDVAPAFADVAVKAECLVLSEDVNVAQVGVDAIGKGDVDDAVVSAKGHGWFSAVAGQRIQPLTGASRQQYSQRVF